MDKLVMWTKNNQAIALAMGVLIVALAYTQLSKPRTYEDCLLQVVEEAKSDNSASIGSRACRAKFPLQIPKFDNTKPFEVLENGTWKKVYPNTTERGAIIDPFVIHRQNGHEYNFLED